MVDEKARAWIIHYPEDSYYGKAPDELRMYPLTPEEIKDGLEQTPLYALSPGSTGEAEGLKLGSRLTVDGVEAVVVPVEPSEAMLRAGAGGSGEDSENVAFGACRAMLSAAGER